MEQRREWNKGEERSKERKEQKRERIKGEKGTNERKEQGRRRNQVRRETNLIIAHRKKKIKKTGGSRRKDGKIRTQVRIYTKDARETHP